MRALTADEMRQCDRRTALLYGVSTLELMRNAAAAVADVALRQFADARQVVVLAGRGNNGGDGLMAARILAEAGREVRVLLTADPELLEGDAATAWRELGSVVARVVTTHEEVASLPCEWFVADLVIDALLGTGYQPPLRGAAEVLISRFRGVPAKFLAVDLPSGWSADSIEPFSVDALPADAVVTFTAPRPAHLFGHLTRSGRAPVLVAPIGTPQEAIDDVVHAQVLRWAGAAHELVREPRSQTANKGSYGHVLVVGGSFGAGGAKAGAVSMAGVAALRSGAGLVTAAVPMTALATVAAVQPELMVAPLLATSEGAIDEQPPEALAQLLGSKTVLAIGPGLGQAAETAAFLAALLECSDQPLVLDADALNLVAAQEPLRSLVRRQGRGGRFVVVTPHPGEMARLAGITVASVQANRGEAARRLAGELGVTVVLKGARTVVAHPSGELAVNTTGNPAQAKGGSGDVLCGMVAALIASHRSQMRRAVEAAVVLHGLAADFTVERMDEHTVLATDTLADLSRAFRSQSMGRNGYVWLQGLAAALSHPREEQL